VIQVLIKDGSNFGHLMMDCKALVELGTGRYNMELISKPSERSEIGEKEKRNRMIIMPSVYSQCQRVSSVGVVVSPSGVASLWTFGNRTFR
jgi:hypothetical protein